MENCDGDADKLKTSFPNVMDHYKNIHDNCHPSSRCKLDPNYEPSKVILTSSTAETLLKNTITRTSIYKEALFALDTFYAENFNNVLNIFHGKRISLSLGKQQYRLITDLAVIQWNENLVDLFLLCGTSQENLGSLEE